MLLYGAIGVGVAATAIGAYHLYRSSGGNISLLAGGIKNGLPLLDSPEDWKTSLSKVNPGLVKWHTNQKSLELINGSSTNCMLCTTTYDLRRRGYDVTAGLDRMGPFLPGRGYMPDDLFSQIYTDYQGTTKVGNDISIINLALEQFPEGSRGNIMVWWPGYRGGHSMIWERMSDGIHFMDGQTNQEYTDFARQILSHADKFKPVELLRTDNLTVNYNNITIFVNTSSAADLYKKHGAEVVTRAILKSPEGKVGLALGAIGVGSLVKSQRENKMLIENYRYDHPRTRLSDEEILEMLTKEY